jgi:Zn-dependent protease
MVGQWYVSLGRWFSVPVLAHWSILLSLPYYVWRNHGLRGGLIVFCAYALLLLVHELGHAAVCRWRRVPVRGIELLLFHGLCRHAAPRREWDSVLIAWGGVAAQMVVVALTLGLIRGLQWAPLETQWWAIPLARYFIDINLITAAFNLLPIPPLDGAIAWRALPLGWSWLRGKWRKAETKPVGPQFRTREELEAEAQRVASNVVVDMKAYAARRQKRRNILRWPR